MKTLLFIILALIAFWFGACSSSPGPAERAGRAVDNAVYNVGVGVERTGQKIQEAAQ